MTEKDLEDAKPLAEVVVTILAIDSETGEGRRPTVALAAAAMALAKLCVMAKGPRPATIGENDGALHIFNAYYKLYDAAAKKA
jgi:hypothetical protein